MQAWLGLGANLQHPVMRLKQALTRLGQAEGIEVAKVSSFYRTPPWGVEHQDDYINAVVQIETSLDPLALLHGLQSIENGMGRERSGHRWGPRVIDIDLLLFGDEMVHSTELVVPHPRMHLRAFVLLPLSELDENIEIPGRGVVGTLLSQLDCDGIYRLNDDAGEV
jgi:2-amino-4-hydroxy-6-hydroxymethyldihydropteridine diphosphokinase